MFFHQRMQFLAPKTQGVRSDTKATKLILDILGLGIVLVLMFSASFFRSPLESRITKLQLFIARFLTGLHCTRGYQGSHSIIR
jgi:hypothetical protein